MIEKAAYHIYGVRLKQRILVCVCLCLPMRVCVFVSNILSLFSCVSQFMLNFWITKSVNVL